MKTKLLRKIRKQYRVLYKDNRHHSQYKFLGLFWRNIEEWGWFDENTAIDTINDEIWEKYGHIKDKPTHVSWPKKPNTNKIKGL